MLLSEDQRAEIQQEQRLALRGTDSYLRKVTRRCYYLKTKEQKSSKNGVLLYAEQTAIFVK